MTRCDAASLYFEDVCVGAETPTFQLYLSVQRLVMEAAASRSFSPIHHDHSAAIAAGTPGMSAGVLLLSTVFEATLRQWMGLEGKLSRLQITFLGFNCAGDKLTCSGRVVGLGISDSRGTVDLELSIETAHGETARARAIVQLPIRRATSHEGTT